MERTRSTDLGRVSRAVIIDAVKSRLASNADTSYVGLCENCEYARHVEAKETTVFLCERSLTDPTFPKYPRLPVRQCLGYVKFEGLKS
jgi:hypothetical protein